jgi:uncharacterized phage protein (TIGR01671 family)
MREVKFRAWDKETKKIEFVDQLYFTQQYVNYIDQRFCGNYMHNVDLMQYTGLKDKNGVEIYEGDIVKLWKENRTLLGNIGIVKFKSGEFSIVSPEFEHHDDIRLRKFCTHLEVIGNIYENPELLNC